MKLSDAHTSSLIESRFIQLIYEEGEGPRWKFKYDGWKNDPSPDILLLGAYKNPQTGNNLVGGINLNYLDNTKRDQLAKSLPKIINAGNLYSRYNIGKRILPDIFLNFYRTYDASKIHGVSKDVLYPKYGFVKSAQNFVKNAVGYITKTKQQRELDAQPKFDADLSNMQDKLDKTVASLSQRQPVQVQQPELEIARQELQPEPIDTSMQQFNAANNDLQTTQLQNKNVNPRTVDKTALYSQIPQQLQTQVDVQKTEPTSQIEPTDPRVMRKAITKEINQNQKELEELEQSEELEEPQELENQPSESIKYYSKQHGKYITESININKLAYNVKQIRYSSSTRKILSNR